MERVRHPYELLIRWDSQGRLAAAHVQWRDLVTDGATVVAETLSDATPVGVAGAAGFPLSDVLERVHVDALTRIAELEAARQPQS